MADSPSLRRAHRAAADAGRRAAESVGARPTSVTIRTRTYTGSVNADGVSLSTTSDLVLSPRPKVTASGDGASSYYGGSPAVDRALAREYTVGPITLAYDGGGYTLSQLAPSPSPSVRVTYVLEGNDFESGGEEFELTGYDASRPHQVVLRLARTRQGS